jgi:ABC-type dipeptide/oligopeptide/nickel transport system ATPase component
MRLWRCFNNRTGALKPLGSLYTFMDMEILEIEYPTPLEKAIYTTNMMREATNRTLSIHRGAAMVAFTGEAGTGKTTTARELCAALKRKFSSENPLAFKGIHFEYGRMPPNEGNEGKRALNGVFAAVGLYIDAGEYNMQPLEEIARQLVAYLRLNRIQMIFADEVGLLGINAIGGLITLLDVAEIEGWNLTIVLMGMDDLALKLRRRQQINRRIHEWIYFNRYDLDDTIALLKVMHPYFAELDEKTNTGTAQFEFVHEITLGLPGFMFPFISRFNYRWSIVEDKSKINVEFLEAVHLITQKSMDKAINLAQSEHVDEKGKSNGKKK